MTTGLSRLLDPGSPEVLYGQNATTWNGRATLFPADSRVFTRIHVFECSPEARLKMVHRASASRAISANCVRSFPCMTATVVFRWEARMQCRQALFGSNRRRYFDAQCPDHPRTNSA
jgi:hypothetical protein